MRRSENRIIYCVLDEDDYEFVLHDVNSRNMLLKGWIEKAVAQMRRLHGGGSDYEDVEAL